VLQPAVLRSDAFQRKRFSGVGILVFLICIVAGVGVTVQTGSRAGMLSGVLVGAYFLLAIKIVDQWERVAVLRFGRFRALKGPGVFLIIPIVDTLSRYVDQRVRVTNGERGINADAGHGAGECGCHRVLAGVECREGDL
jgi:hypothetical protein